jgi:hypothetical protein
VRESFLELWLKRPNDEAAFDEGLTSAIEEVGAERLMACAKEHIDKVHRESGSMRYLQRPENWLADKGYRHYDVAAPALSSPLPHLEY